MKLSEAQGRYLDGLEEFRETKVYRWEEDHRFVLGNGEKDWHSGVDSDGT